MPTPLVSVVLAVHDGARFVGTAIESVLWQTLGSLELVVVDDASADETPARLAALDDDRVVVLRNEEQLGLAASLNRALDVARGRYVARLDADDVALPRRLERQVAAAGAAAVVGTAILDLDAAGRPGKLHVMPQGPLAVRWHALFGAPFFHPTVLVEREALDRHGLRYDTAYGESEDYDLWTRLLAHADGANLAEPLVLKRVHPGQASLRRRELQEELQRSVALREIERLAPRLPDPELAWRLGSGRALAAEDRARAAAAFRLLLARFDEVHGIDPDVHLAAARALARNGEAWHAVADPASLAADVARARVRRVRATPRARRRARGWLAALADRPLRVTVVSPEPTPYRAPLLDRVAHRSELELTVLYAARTVAGREWEVAPEHRAVFLAGARVPGLRRALRHEYHVAPGVVGELRRSRPDVVVVSGWSTFAAQAALAWCRARRVPYVLLVESHDLGPRPGWRRAVKGAVVPRIVRGAAGVLAVGSLARESVIARGAAPERVGIFANTIDVDAWAERADRLAARRTELRASLGAAPGDLVVLSAARLAPEKGLDVLVRAAARVDGALLALAGAGPQAAALERLAADVGTRLVALGNLGEERLAEVYVAADVFALLSRHEPWGVVVNEAAASGLPLVLADRVGAAHDLLREGENGYLVPPDDVDAAAAALRRLADPDLRRRLAERSRELVRAWGYEPSVEAFVAAVRDAAAR